MIALAFIAFAILVVAWLLAPNGALVEKVEKPEPAKSPSVTLGEATASVPVS